MTQPIVPEMNVPADDTYVARINADYVKQIEGAGARVVPVPHTADIETLGMLFDSLNGILFPGGPDILNGTQYYNASKYMLDRAIAANKDGDHFPVWGTCLGFQLLCVAADGDDVSILSPVTAENLTLPVFLSPGANTSKMFGSFPGEAMTFIDSGEFLMEQFHHFGVSPDTFHQRGLDKMYRILATNRDRSGVEFISAIEAHDMPIYGVQFHPERSLFEWTLSEDVAHSRHAVFVAQQFGNLLVGEAVKSKHHFRTASEEDKALIYNWSRDLHYTQPTHPDSNQYYLFKETPIKQWAAVLKRGWMSGEL